MGDILNFVGSGVIPIFLIIIVAVLIVSYIGSRYKVAGAGLIVEPPVSPPTTTPLAPPAPANEESIDA